MWPLPPSVADIALVAVVAVFAGADLAVNDPSHRQDDWFSWTVFAVAVLPLLVRRRWPVVVAVVTGAACAGWALYGHVGEALNVPVIVALYTVAVQGDRRRSIRVGVVAALVSGVVAVIAGIDVARPQGAPLLEMVWPLIPLLLGEAVRGRRELTAEYAARAVMAETEREREAARRVQEERLRIARELHDVVAHTVSAMTVQAGVALDAFEARPDLALVAMRQVRASGKDAVRELRATVALLRDESADDDRVPAGPAPRLEQLGELVDRMAAAGVEVRFHQDRGNSDDLPPVVELAAYRIVQEALTNILKHSRAAHAAVSVIRTGAELTVEITDDGPASGTTDSNGYGLVGMDERAAAVGGRIERGRLPAGGFRVFAALPTDGGRR